MTKLLRYWYWYWYWVILGCFRDFGIVLGFVFGSSSFMEFSRSGFERLDFLKETSTYLPPPTIISHIHLPGKNRAIRRFYFHS